MTTEGRNRAILLVDDAPSSVAPVRAALENEGYDVIVTIDGETAIEIAETFEPDLILLDIMMPEMDGFETCRLLKESDKTGDIPIIFLSGLTDTFEKVKGFDLGAVDYVTKPVKIGELLSRVKTHLKIASLQMELKTINSELEERVAVRTEELHKSNLQLKKEISERVRVEGALKEQYDFLQTLIDSVPISIFFEDENGVCIGCNYAHANLLGLAKEEIIGSRALDILPRELVEARLKPDGKGAGTPDARFCEGRITPAGAPPRDVLFSKATYTNANGRVIGLIGAIIDITERNEAEKAIRQAKKDWERTFDTVPDLVAILDTDYRVVRVNKAMAERLNCEPEECIGQTCFKLFHGTDSPPLFCMNERMIETGREQIVEVREERLDGDFILSISPIFDDEGRLTGSVHVARDITERKRLENRLRQAYRMEAIGTLAGGVAHDFNNTLMPILGYADLLKGNIKKDAPEYYYVTQMKIAAGRAKDLVRQILTFSRKSDQGLKLVRMKSLIKEALKLIRASLPATIEIRNDIRSETTVNANPTQIHQLMINLCTNAGHAMREKGGVLEVELRDVEVGSKNGISESETGLAPGVYVKLSVTDNGCGMPAHMLNRIFDPFFTTKEKGEGTGMGLSVVHGIVESLDGVINVSSEPGVGTRFNVYLPALGNKSETASKKDQPIPRGTESILLVDDEPMVADVTGHILKSLGYRVVQKNSGVEALESFVESPDGFDLVITDMTMPKMTGKELADRILELRPDAPIILCTGFGMDVEKETSLTANIEAVILKPILKKDLAETVRSILDSTRKGRHGEHIDNRR